MRPFTSTPAVRNNCRAKGQMAGQINMMRETILLLIGFAFGFIAPFWWQYKIIYINLNPVTEWVIVGWRGWLLFMQVGISNDIIAKWKTRAKDKEFVELLSDLMLKNLIGIIWHDISWNWQRKWLSPLIDLIRKISTLEFPVIIMLLFIQSICLGRHFCIISGRLLGSTRAMWFTLITKS